MMILNQGKEEYLALKSVCRLAKEIVFTPLCREPKVPYLEKANQRLVCQRQN